MPPASAGFADGLVYDGSSILGGTSISESTSSNAHQGEGSITHLQTGNMTDAASCSISSELFYPPSIDTPQNGGSVTGGASFATEDAGYAVEIAQREYVNDAAFSRSRVSESINPKVDNLSNNVFGGTSVAGGASVSGSTYAGYVNYMQGEYVNDAVSKSMVSESIMTNPSTENTNNPSYPSS